MGEDGLTMVLVPGGNLVANPGDQRDQNRRVHLKPFYMDENKVSNESFVQFLNEVKDDLIVEKGVVKSNGRIWFLMGEGTEVYEHIIHQHGRFHLKDLQAASLPVVRVTWYGAMAYADHYHKQLPSEDQWIYAAFHGRVSENGFLKIKKGVPVQGDPKTSSDLSDHLSHMDYSLEQPSKGGLPERLRTSETPSQKNPPTPKNMGGEIKEWAVRGNTKTGSVKISNTPQTQIAYESVILGKPSLLGKSKIRSQFISNRYPWEGFPNVGFRCIIEVGK